MTIPKVIYQSWKDKVLNDSMKNATDIVKKLNPEYKYVLFDDEDCRKYLLNNFGNNYANAFDAIIPGAYKCDFWRYAVLYKEGGIYLDIDMIPLKPFKEVIKTSDRFVSVVDVKSLTALPCAIFQAFIAVEPGHPIMKYALEQCFYNIASRRKEPFFCLSLTGPILMGVAVNLYWNKKETHGDIPAGEYDYGVKLLDTDNKANILDLNGEMLIKNKYDGYDRGLTDYANIKVEQYTDDPRKPRYEKIKNIAMIVIVILIISILCNLFLSYKFYKKKK